MNKTKLSTIIFTALAFLCCIFCLVSCGSDDDYQAHTHIYSSEWSKDGTYHWQACQGCEKIRNKTEHDWDFGIITLRPTETGDGVRTFTCNSCGQTKLQSITANDTHEHVFITYISNKNATCTKDGTKTAVCEVCREVADEVVDVGSAKGHSYVSGQCSVCGVAEGEDTLEVESIAVDKTLLMANEQVTFTAVANKNSNDLLFTAVVYLNGEKIATLSDMGELKFAPTLAGRYDVEVSVTDGGENVFAHYFKSCFEVKAYWYLSEIVESSNNVSLGDLLSFNAQIAGDLSDLSCDITVYKDGVSYCSVEECSNIEFYPNTAGTYYAIITARDSYGETQTAKSGNVVVELLRATNPVLSVNYGTTLNIDELEDKEEGDIVVPSGQNIIVTWNKRASDSYYRLDLYAHNNESDPYEKVIKNYTSNSYTIASSNLIAGHEYCATLRRYNASGNYEDITSIYFTVYGANSIMTEKRFEIISPIDKAVYVQNDITVQWTKLNYASKYVLSLEYDCGKSYHKVLENVEISNTQNTYTFSKSVLQQGCEHRLKIYAYDSLGNELNEIIVFRMEGDKEKFELCKPEFTETHFYEEWVDDMKSYPTYEDVVVTWKDVPKASYYSVSIDSHYSVIDDPILVNADYITDNTFSIPISSLVSGCVYSVRISVYCSDGHKFTSDRGYFRVPYSDGTTIRGPELTSHDFSKDEGTPTTIVEQALTIEWKPVSAAVSYSVYWTENDCDSPEFEAKNLTTTSVTIPKSCVSYWGESSYYILKIVAKDRNGITEGAYYYVRVVESALEVPILVSPVLATDDEETLTSFDRDITLKWDAVEGAVSYKVRVWECYDGDLFELFAQDGITDTSFVIPLDELYFGGVFRVSIRANDQHGGCSKSSIYYFQVGESNYLGLSVDNWNPAHEADYRFAYVETVSEWTAETSASWIDLSSTSGVGTTRLKISVAENTGDSARYGRITFTNTEGGRAVFSITQEADSSKIGLIEIVSPYQNEVVEDDMLTAKWTVKYGYAYFELDLFDLTDDKVAYNQSDIVALYHQIPASCIEQGHSYQLTISIFDYSENKGAETSIIFKVEGDILPSIPSDDTDSDEDTPVGSITQACSHTFYKKELVKTEYTNLNKTLSVHNGYSLYNKVCIGCGISLETEKISFSNNAHKINSKRYCSCGFTDTDSYVSWSATNNSGQRTIVYQTPESTVQYGYIHDGERVTVLAECCGRYLIEYTLDGQSGTKQGYVNKYSLNREKPEYSIYINDEYFNKSSEILVVEKNTSYPIYIESNKTSEFVKCGTYGFTCTSSNTNIATVDDSGTLVVKGAGASVITLMKDGEVLDQLIVYGCTQNSRVTNYSTLQLNTEGFAPNCRLKVFNYESMFIGDESIPGGGYYKVSFDVYNDVPTIFSVGVFDSEGNVVKQTLIDGYTADMYGEMASTFIHFGDWFNGAMWRGESEMYSQKTHVELDVPLGGYVDFLTLKNSDYMVFANILSGIVVGAMETTEAWADYIAVKSPDVEVDEVKFGQMLIEKISKNANMTAEEVIDKVIELTWESDDYAAIATSLMGFISNSGVTLEDLFAILTECCDSMMAELITEMVTSIMDKGLSIAVPPAGVIKTLTDAVVKTLQFAIVIKDVGSMAGNNNDFLIIMYPSSPIY